MSPSRISTPLTLATTGPSLFGAAVGVALDVGAGVLVAAATGTILLLFLAAVSSEAGQQPPAISGKTSAAATRPARRKGERTQSVRTGSEVEVITRSLR